MRLSTGAGWVALLLAACDGKGEGPAGDDAADADTDTDADADSDTDADTDADSDADTDADSDADSDSDTADSAALPAVVFDDVWPILDANCSGCHSSDQFHPGFRMNTPQNAYDALLNDTPDDPGGGWVAYVVPFDPATSILVDKIENNNPGYGGNRMPTNGQLTGQQKQLIRDWILDGALAQ